MYKSFKNLDVWKKSIEMVDSVYDATDSFPQNERYALAQQINRCAVSVPSNIAEGHERNSTKEFIQFLGIARASLAELETQVIISQNRSYISAENAENLYSSITHINKMLWKLMASLNDRINNESRFSNLSSLVSKTEGVK